MKNSNDTTWDRTSDFPIYFVSSISRNFGNGISFIAAQYNSLSLSYIACLIYKCLFQST